MIITERTLKKWRREALQFREDIKGIAETEPTVELCDRILRMTQVLLDQHLLKKEVR